MTRHVDGYAHGTRSRYVWGCRCVECRQANTAGLIRYRHHGSTVDPTSRTSDDAKTNPRKV